MIPRVLNLYAGIGGNRALWPCASVTAVERDPAIAAVYAARFPADTVIVGDAHRFLEAHVADFDFIWSSPPCPTHGQYRHHVGVCAKGYAPVMPDMSLYAEIVFLSTYARARWIVENVRPYYTPLVPPTAILSRHLFWSNVALPPFRAAPTGLRTKNKIGDFPDAALLRGTAIPNKRQVLRNCVDPALGLHCWSAVFPFSEA